MKEFILEYWLETLFSGVLVVLSTGMKMLYTKMKTELTRQRCMEDALIAILHSVIYTNCSAIIERGSITVAELDNLECLYKGYYALGGNGTGETMYKRCKNLPLVTDLKGGA